MTRAEAMEVYRRAKGSDDLRALCVGDLFFLLRHVIGRTDMDHDWLYERCREVQRQPDGFIDLWARGHYKSTIITFGLTIQEILRNPEITVGIISFNRPSAKSFPRQIKREFETNAALRELFPHIAPPKTGEKRTWSEDDGGIVVRREGNPKEGTVEAAGLVEGGTFTGKHFNMLVYDDVVTPESVTTPEMIRKTTDAWRVSLNLGARGGHIRMIGTRYHAADTYAAILEQKSVAPRIYPATVDGTPEGAPVFLSRDVLAEKRRDMGPFIFACQMLQDPLADKAQGFSAEWWKRLPGDAPDAARMNRYIVVDPANEKKKGNDYTSMWVVGLNTDGNYYVLDGIHDRLNLAERARALFELHRKWNPSMTGYERYGMQADIDFMRMEMERQNYRFPIVELGGQTPKADRIRRLVPVFEQGRIFFPNRLMKLSAEQTAYDLTDDFYKQEYLTFPVSSHDDMLDCLSRIVDPALGAVFPRQPGSVLHSSSLPRRAVQASNLYA